MPVPPPIEENFSMMSMVVAASTQVAIAKYPLRSRETSHHIGSAATPHPMAATGSAAIAALPVAAIGCGVAALPMWWLVSRLRSGYFAIATWVLAATTMLIIEKFSSIGGGTGMPLPGFAGLDPTLLTAYTYWAGLAVTVVALVSIYLLLRGRLGLVLTAIRDDEVAARSSGARVGLARMLVFVVAGAGCGAAGAVL